jgi:hypothetical protein
LITQFSLTLEITVEATHDTDHLKNAHVKTRVVLSAVLNFDSRCVTILFTTEGLYRNTITTLDVAVCLSTIFATAAAATLFSSAILPTTISGIISQGTDAIALSYTLSPPSYLPAADQATPGIRLVIMGASLVARRCRSVTMVPTVTSISY